MIIRIYVDGDTTPVAELPGSSGRLKLDTTSIPDGAHRLRIETLDGDRVTGKREIPFTVRNGYLDLPTGPGLGIELDENALAGKINHDWRNQESYDADDGSVVDW